MHESWPGSASMSELSHLSPDDLAIETSGLTKVFGATRAIDGVDLAVRAGCVYAFLGPNGAGKTTTIRILTTLLRPDAGTARVLGHDVVKEPEAVRRGVSLTCQFASVDEDLTGFENLVLLTRLLGYSWRRARTRAGELLDSFGLADAARRQVTMLSGGMRRRLDIAASLIVRPDVLFLDEPTTGLDPRSRRHVWEIVRTIVKHGTTVLLTTQYLEEADHLADRVAVIDHGKVIAEGTPGELKALLGAGSLRVRLIDPERRAEACKVLSAELGVRPHPASDPAALSAHIAATDGACEVSARVANALAMLSRSGIEVSDFSLGQPGLEEVFLALTGHAAETRDQTADVT